MTEDAIVHRPHQSDPNGTRYVFLAPRSHVKEVKSALEKNASFDKHHGISPDPADEHQMRIPTTISALATEPEDTTLAELLTELNLSHLAKDITLFPWTPPTTTSLLHADPNPLRRALRQALESLSPDTLPSPETLPLSTLISTFPDSYSIYKPLLLLPSTALPPVWLTFIAETSPATLEKIWSHIATAMDCTHIALNSPIPAANTSSTPHASDAENILRSPVNLTPLYGSFGSPVTSQTLSHPTAIDFDNALWVHTTQNGIRQTWAPQYTMFSRGNVKEKARILRLASASLTVGGSSASEDKTNCAAKGAGATAVDLYAGIGYFAFSYRRAGHRQVLCWELNPWSIEGLRRGAALNGWRARILGTSDVPSQDATVGEWATWCEGVARGGEDLLVFAMSNETADGILAHLAPCVEPVRHVNLGLLPVSRLSWPTAVRAVDAVRGGWVHAHENVGVVDLEQRRGEVEAEFTRLIGELRGHARTRTTEVKVEHVEKVKMYAPGVVHAVFDVYVPGTPRDG